MTPSKIFFILLLLLATEVKGQSRLNINTTKSCSYYGEEIKDDLYGFKSTPEAEDIVQRIVHEVGLEQNFEIQAANVPNAIATVKDGKRLILYSQNFILGINSSTGTDWAGISILAHEIGHHLNGHTITLSGSRPDLELQADKFSGFVCAKLGASLKQAQAAVNSFDGSSASETHPPKSARLEAIAIGWKRGSSGSNPIPSGPSPNPQIGKKEEVVEIDDEEQEHFDEPIIFDDPIEKKTTASVNIVYIGDNYGCSLPIRITIAGLTYTPNSNYFTVHQIPTGKQPYTIEGQINCMTLGSCQAYGEGYINIYEGAEYYITWQNDAYASCKIWFESR